MQVSIRSLFVLATLILFCSGATYGSEYQSLFNGRNLNGWTKRGGDATYQVEGNTIVGKRGEGPNTFLCTKKQYENFILKFQVKFDEKINSGVQFRSNARKDGDREVVFGYQCELDADQMTGAIYDESRRGRWLQTLTPEVVELAKTAFKQNEWNDLTIQCVGPSIKTWLNGKMISDLIDTVDSKGFIALQVHSAAAGQVRWRNIMIKELPQTPWTQLMAKGDKEMKGLDIKTDNAGSWTMDDEGVVVANHTSAEKNDGLVLTKKNIPNFATKVTFKQELGNSGLYIRAEEINASYWVKGIQGEIDANQTGGIWEVAGRGWISAPPADLKEVIGKAFKANEWNDFSVVGIGDRIVTNLNGNEIAQIVDPKVAKDGKIGLQLHGGADVKYSFKDFAVMPLDDAAVKMIQSVEEPTR